MSLRRLPTDICLLCQEKTADKTNSHLISKFLARGVFKERQTSELAVEYNKIDKSPRQDAPKVSHILCSDCEESIAKLETRIAFKLHKVLNDPNIYHPNTRKVFTGNFEAILTLPILDVSDFTAFVYSLFWRGIIGNSVYIDFSQANTELAKEELREYLLGFFKGETNLKKSNRYKFNVTTTFGDPKWVGLMFGAVSTTRLGMVVNNLLFYLDLDEKPFDDLCMNSGTEYIRFQALKRTDWNDLMHYMQKKLEEEGRTPTFIHPKRNNK